MFKMYWLLAGISIMLECLYSSQVSNEAQSIENTNDRKRLQDLRTKITYILKQLPKVIAQQSRKCLFLLQFTWKQGQNYLFSLGEMYSLVQKQRPSHAPSYTAESMQVVLQQSSFPHSLQEQTK